ncbi:MAG: hypothetical protein AB1428_13025 [Bacteroidota bacterium]
MSDTTFVEQKTILSIRHQKRPRIFLRCGHQLRIGQKTCIICKMMRLKPVRTEERKDLPFYVRP